MAAELPSFVLPKLINMFSFLWKILMNWNIKTMTFKKHGDFLMKINLFKLLFFTKKKKKKNKQKKQTYVSLRHKDFKKHLLIKASNKK